MKLLKSAKLMLEWFILAYYFFHLTSVKVPAKPVYTGNTIAPILSPPFAIEFPLNHEVLGTTIYLWVFLEWIIIKCVVIIYNHRQFMIFTPLSTTCGCIRWQHALIIRLKLDVT